MLCRCAVVRSVRAGQQRPDDSKRNVHLHELKGPVRCRYDCRVDLGETPGRAEGSASLLTYLRSGFPFRQLLQAVMAAYHAQESLRPQLIRSDQGKLESRVVREGLPGSCSTPRTDGSCLADVSGGVGLLAESWRVSDCTQDPKLQALRRLSWISLPYPNSVCK